jgi:hypothetical protein
MCTQELSIGERICARLRRSLRQARQARPDVVNTKPTSTTGDRGSAAQGKGLPATYLTWPRTNHGPRRDPLTVGTCVAENSRSPVAGSRGGARSAAHTCSTPARGTSKQLCAEHSDPHRRAPPRPSARIRRLASQTPVLLFKRGRAERRSLRRRKIRTPAQRRDLGSRA